MPLCATSYIFTVTLQKSAADYLTVFHAVLKPTPLHFGDIRLLAGLHKRVLSELHGFGARVSTPSAPNPLRSATRCKARCGCAEMQLPATLT
jgi:hypothetical protein